MAVWGFWAAAFGITLGVFVLISKALRQTPASVSENPSVGVYRDQLTEVGRDLARGVISQLEADRVRVEVSRRLLEADRAGNVALRTGGLLTQIVSLGIIAAGMLAAVAGYVWLGAPGYPDLPLAKRLAQAQIAYETRPNQDKAEQLAPPETPAMADPEFMDLMTKLRAAVVSRPDDLQGLALLAQNESRLGNYKAARAASASVVALKATRATAQDHETLAQMMIAAAGGFVSPEAEAQLIAALNLEPQRGWSRYLSGLMFAQTGRPDRSFALWQALLEEGPPDAPWIAPVRENIAAIAEMAGVRYSLPDVKGPDAAAIAAAGAMTDADRQAMIAGMVGQLQDRLDSEGGPVSDWVKLINALAVVGDSDGAKATVAKATAAFAGKTDDLAAIAAAAKTAGLAP